MEENKINKANAIEAYNKATGEVKGNAQFIAITPTDDRPITERVKTYEDACKVLGVEPQDYSDMPYDVAAYLKLRIIVEALNEGWSPQLTLNEHRYYPWFSLYTRSEINRMNDDEKESIKLIDTDLYLGSYAGIARQRTILAPTNMTTYIGSHLCCKTLELARYCGKQFLDIWADFHLIRK